MIALRPLRPDDIPIIRSWPPYPPEFSMLDYALRDGGWLDEYRGKEATEILVAEDGDDVIGFSLLTKKTGTSAEFRIALHPHRLGLGRGRTITLLTLARGFSGAAYEKIVLIVRKNNPRAQRLYESIGFRPCGECTELVNGENVPFLQMEIDRKTFEGVKTMSEALLVIDVQNEYFTGKLPVTYPHGSIVAILQAMDAAHAARMPVVVIQHANRAAGAVTFVPGTPGWELYLDVKKRPHDVLIEKTLPGSFTGTNLEAWLKERKIDTLTIAGYMTQMCCDTTARQAFHRGYAVKFLSDATGTLAITNSAGSVSAEELHRAILVTQQMRFSQVMTTEEWISSLAISYP